MMDISVITVNFNEKRYTRKCVESLLKMKRVSFEIIVIENSTIQSEKVGDLFSKNRHIHVYEMVKNIGVSTAYNLGIKYSQARYVFILNNDTEILDSYALFKLKNFLDRNKQVAICQPKIKSLSKKDFFEYAGAAGGYLDKYGYPFCRGRVFQSSEKDQGQYEDVVEITWATTCAFFARKNVLKKVGLFDPIYFAYAEEVDIALRIWEEGYKIMYTPVVEIFHKGESSWKKRRGRKTYLIHRNHLILFLRIFSLKHILFHFPIRILFEYISVIFYLIYNSSYHIIFVFYSHLTILFLLPRIIRKREVFEGTSYRSYAPIYNSSIVLDHFIFGKNNFSELSRKRFIKMKELN